MVDGALVQLHAQGAALLHHIGLELVALHGGDEAGGLVLVGGDVGKAVGVGALIHHVVAGAGLGDRGGLLVQLRQGGAQGVGDALHRGAQGAAVGDVLPGLLAVLGRGLFHSHVPVGDLLGVILQGALQLFLLLVGALHGVAVLIGGAQGDIEVLVGVVALLVELLQLLLGDGHLAALTVQQLHQLLVLDAVHGVGPVEGIPGDAHVLKGGLVVGPGGVGDGVGLGLLILGELLAQLLELGLQVVGAVEVVQGPVFDPLLGGLAVHLAVQHLYVGGDLHGGLVVGGGQVVDVAADGHGVVAQLGGPGVVLAVAAGEAEAQGQSQHQGNGLFQHILHGYQAFPILSFLQGTPNIIPQFPADVQQEV